MAEQYFDKVSTLKTFRKKRWHRLCWYLTEASHTERNVIRFLCWVINTVTWIHCESWHLYQNYRIMILYLGLLICIAQHYLMLLFPGLCFMVMYTYMSDSKLCSTEKGLIFGLIHSEETFSQYVGDGDHWISPTFWLIW